jgi:hypothetical protein
MIPESFLVPMGSFLAEALSLVAKYKLQILSLEAGGSITGTTSQMLKLAKSGKESGTEENICRWLM